jgi:hypothetical protein
MLTRASDQSNDLLDPPISDKVLHLRAASLVLNDPLTAEKRQVLRDCGLGEIKIRPDGTYALFGIEQTFENANTNGMAESLENVGPFGIACAVHESFYMLAEALHSCQSKYPCGLGNLCGEAISQ